MTMTMAGGGGGGPGTWNIYTRPPKRTLTPACSLGLADFQALPHLLQEALTDT